MFSKIFLTSYIVAVYVVLTYGSPLVKRDTVNLATPFTLACDGIDCTLNTGGNTTSSDTSCSDDSECDQNSICDLGICVVDQSTSTTEEVDPPTSTETDTSECTCPSDTTTVDCTWTGHCIGDTCSTDDDCDLDYVCSSGNVCESSATFSSNRHENSGDIKL